METRDKRILKGKETRENIIASAIKQFSSKSYDGTSINDITNDIGIPKSLFYHYFKTKDALLQYIISMYDIRITDNEKEAISRKKDSETYGDVATRIFLKLQEGSVILKIIVLEALKNEEIMKMLVEKIDLLGEDFESVLPEDVLSRCSREELVVFRFYFRFIPKIMFALTSDTVSKHYSISQNTLRDHFIELLSYNPYMD